MAGRYAVVRGQDLLGQSTQPALVQLAEDGTVIRDTNLSTIPANDWGRPMGLAVSPNEQYFAVQYDYGTGYLLLNASWNVISSVGDLSVHVPGAVGTPSILVDDTGQVYMVVREYDPEMGAVKSLHQFDAGGNYEGVAIQDVAHCFGEVPV